jgi:hypothetical protein
MTLTSHTLGGPFDPGTASLRDVSFRWQADAEAQMVELLLQPDWDSADPSSAPEGNLTWRVQAPGSVTSFTPFRLPSEVWPRTSQFTASQYRVALNSSFQGYHSRYEDFYAQAPFRDPISRRWTTWVEGALKFR